MRLRRTAIGDISVDDASLLEDLTHWQDALVPAEKLFAHIPFQAMDEEQIKTLKQGQSIEQAQNDEAQILVLNQKGEIESLAYRKDGKLHPRLNF